MTKKEKKLKRIKRFPTYIRRTAVMETITNTKIFPDGSMGRTEVEEEKLVFAGWHSRWRVVLDGERGDVILREVLH